MSGNISYQGPGNAVPDKEFKVCKAGEAIDKGECVVISSVADDRLILATFNLCDMRECCQIPFYEIGNVPQNNVQHIGPDFIV